MVAVAARSRLDSATFAAASGAPSDEFDAFGQFTSTRKMANPAMTARQSAASQDGSLHEDEGDRDQSGAETRILIVNADPATLGLLREWLGAEGHRVIDERRGQDSVQEPIAAVIVDVPFARHGGLELLSRVAARYPGTPVLALSATFFSSVKCSGGCAHALGVTGVLPKPIGREALVTAIRNLLPGHP